MSQSNQEAVKSKMVDGVKVEDAKVEKEEEDDEDEPSNSKRSKPHRLFRKNIKSVISEESLHSVTKEARAEEQARLERLEKHRPPVALVTLSSDDDDDDCLLVSDDDDGLVDPNNSGIHTDDRLNVPNGDGRVLVNVGHPSSEPDIYLDAQIEGAMKAHQVGGVRFMYDNLVESLARCRSSPGLGCVLAHAMVLGKTLQVIGFAEAFLSRTGAATKVLCIVPINTIQNWAAEFDRWLPNRAFGVFLINDANKRTEAIMEWADRGGVLLMGYELYRVLAGGGTASKTKGKRRSRKNAEKKAEPCVVDLEEEEREGVLTDGIRSALLDPGPDLVVCDEGHRIKNANASTSRTLKSIATKRRLVLTGYPLQNNLAEYWCMVDFVRPNYLGSKMEFGNMFERPIQNGQCVDSTPKDVRLMKHRAHVLHEQLKGFVQRRSHAVLKAALPPKVEFVLLVEMTPVQKELYARFMEEILLNGLVSGNPIMAFAVCCKIWNHSDVLFDYVAKRNKAAEEEEEDIEELDLAKLDKSDDDFGWAEGPFEGYVPRLEDNSNKFSLCFAILDETIGAGDRLLVFSQSLLTLNLMESFLQKRNVPGTLSKWVPNVNYYRLDGSTPSVERERLINAFNAGRHDASSDKSLMAVQPLLFLVSTRAGSLGVNLIGANRVVVFDASWNPCHDSQAVCRIYRYGQPRPCHIYRLVTDSSLERRIYDRQISKQGMSNRVVDEMNPDAHLHSKDVLLSCEGDERRGRKDPVTGDDVPVDPDSLPFPDAVLSRVLRRLRDTVTTQPFTHESLLVDRKEERLSEAEKRLAERSFAIAKGAKTSYKRPSHYRQGFNVQQVHAAGSSGPSPTPPTARDVAPTAVHPNYHHHHQPQPEEPAEGGGSCPLEALARQGINIKEVTIPRDLALPTNGSSISLKAGQKVSLIQTPKGIYMRLDHQILKIKLPPSLVGMFGRRDGSSGRQPADGEKENNEVITIDDSPPPSPSATA